MDVSGSGYSPDGGFSQNGSTLDVAQNKALWGSRAVTFSWENCPMLSRGCSSKDTCGNWECAEQKTIYTLLSDARPAPHSFHNRAKARFYFID